MYDINDADFYKIYENVGQDVKKQKRIEIEWDWNFFARIPALNINTHSCNLEFEWLFLGIYINFSK